ncbi:hypothetical protein ACFC3A_12605 [Enterococcus thailandicus]|uniref:hypothetical protein n=1 Tax=Enterococcus thailandicus TaxID=417368 RepID=UPI0039A4B9F3
MLINDNGREYDTDKLSEYSSYTQALIKRLIYLRYVGIRDVLSNSCCNKFKIKQVREELNKENNLKRLQNVFGYEIDEINYYIDFAEEFIPMAR